MKLFAYNPASQITTRTNDSYDYSLLGSEIRWVKRSGVIKGAEEKKFMLQWIK